MKQAPEEIKKEEKRDLKIGRNWSIKSLDKLRQERIIGNAIEKQQISRKQIGENRIRTKLGQKFGPQTCLVGEGADVEKTSVFSLYIHLDKGTNRE
jgi:hypothetical protein